VEQFGGPDAPVRRVAVYSQDGFGMGHLRRTDSIATALLESRADTSVLSICDSPSGQLFRPVGRHDRLKLPTVVKQGPGDWTAPGLGMSFDAVRNLRSAVLMSALQSFEPDLFLVDHMPHGSMGELLPALEVLRRQVPGLRVVLGLRDIIDAPDVVQRRWSVEGAFDAVERYYDQVLVYGSPDLYPAADLYGFPASVRERTSYCGYVVSPQRPPADRVAGMRQALAGDGGPEARLVVVMGGSGHDAAPMMAAAVRATPLLNRRRTTEVVVVCGPHMPQADRRALGRRAAEHGARLVRSVSDAPALIGAADVVVAMAGYNSTVEILAGGTPGVLVPRRGPSAEQRTRARLFGERDWIGVVDPDDLTPASLAVAVETALCRDRTTVPAGLDLHGLDVAASYLSLQLDGISPLSPGLVLGGTDGTA
jgi:predicted glycosyltransferase